jgi:hypothetical protein
VKDASFENTASVLIPLRTAVHRSSFLGRLKCVWGGEEPGSDGLFSFPLLFPSAAQRVKSKRKNKNAIHLKVEGVVIVGDDEEEE